MNALDRLDPDHQVGCGFIFDGLLSFIIRSCTGNCPVQAHGKVEDREWYYRARHGEWTLEVFGNDGSVVWSTEGEDDHDGWGNIESTLAHIGPAMQRYWRERGAYDVMRERFGQEALDKFRDARKLKQKDGE